jgi:hypothetical protein
MSNKILSRIEVLTIKVHDLLRQHDKLSDAEHMGI